MESKFKFGDKYFSFLLSFTSLLLIIATPILTYIFRNKDTISKLNLGAFLIGLGYVMLCFTHNGYCIFILSILWTLGQILYNLFMIISMINIFPTVKKTELVAYIFIGRSCAMGMTSIVSLFLKVNFSFNAIWIFTMICSFVIICILNLIHNNKFL